MTTHTPAAQAMHAVLSGTVTHCAVTLREPNSSRPFVYLHVVARQAASGQEWEAFHYLGRGYAACADGDKMRARLAPGTVVEAHGTTVEVRTVPATGVTTLVLAGVQYIRGGDTPQRHRPARGVQELLARLEARRVRVVPLPVGPNL